MGGTLLLLLAGAPAAPAILAPATRVKPTNPKLRRGRETTGIYAAWPLAHRGTPARDYVGSNALTFNGAVAWATGPDGPAVRFPGAGTAYLQTTAAVINPSTTDFTAAVWFSIDAITGSAQILLAQMDGTGTGRNWLNVTSAGMITSFLGGASTTGTTVMTVGAIHHGVLTNQGTTVKLYLDGLQEATATRTVENNSASLRVGASKSGTTPLAGTVGRSGVTLWTRALSAAEVARLYADPYRIWTPRRRWAEYAVVGGGLPPGVIAHHRKRKRVV